MIFEDAEYALWVVISPVNSADRSTVEASSAATVVELSSAQRTSSAATARAAAAAAPAGSGPCGGAMRALTSAQAQALAEALWGGGGAEEGEEG